MTMKNSKTVFDFSRNRDQQPWDVIDDRIMGGSSRGGFAWSDRVTLFFQGEVSLENLGGFASLRSPAGTYNLSGRRQAIIRVKGDGRRYQLGLRIDRYYDGVTYLAEFAPAAGQWEEVVLPFEDFLPTHHGQVLANAAALDLARIKSFALLISGQQEGTFRLEVVWIKVA